MNDRAALANRVCVISAALMLAVFFCSFLVPIWDIDFWWHIATGRWMVENHHLPGTDPFGVYPDATGPRNDVLLKGYWLAQIIFYELFQNFGPEGITSLRALILTLCLVLVFVRGRTLGAGPAVCLFVTGLAGFNALGFTGERPQLFSFLFASLAFLIVERAGKTGSRSLLFTLPAVSIVWANCHGGVALGAVLLILYLCAMYAIVKLWDKGENIDMPALTGAVLSFALLTLATPSGISLYELLWTFQGSVLQQRTSGYLSSFLIYRIAGVTPQLWVALFFAAVLLSLPGFVRKAPAGAVVTLFVGALSAMSFRYHAFFVFVAAPYAALGLGALIEKLDRRSITPRLVAPGAIIMAAGAVSIVLMLYAKDVDPAGINAARFPADSVDYMAEKKLKGRVFNFMGWGGYLIWRLDPDIKVYVDGRMLDDARLTPYTHILWATREGLEWFGKESFDYVLIPYRNASSGEVYGLNNFLLRNEGWTAIHHGEKGILFARNKSLFFTPY